MDAYILSADKSLVLRSCKPDLISQKNFQWPELGEAICPDWEPTTECGNGLHGWLWATGDFSLKVNHPYAKWLVVEVDTSSIIELNGKVKFPKGNVILTGTFREAYDLTMKWFWLREAKNITSATGYSGHASATGDSSHASATGKYGHASATGKYGHASATGYSGHASATGKYGHASATGYSGHASATGDSGHASATGDSGHASATGYSSHASATGYSSHASATGKYGHASATGDSSHASATGDSAIACVLGTDGKAMCGENDSIILTWYDGTRKRHAIGYAGEDGIEAGKWYKVGDAGRLIETSAP